MEIVTRIFYNDRFQEVDPDSAPSTARQLRSFLLYNNAPAHFVRDVGGWYKVTRNCEMLYVNRVLYTMSYKEWLEVALNDKFTANIK